MEKLEQLKLKMRNKKVIAFIIDQSNDDGSLKSNYSSEVGHISFKEGNVAVFTPIKNKDKSYEYEIKDIQNDLMSFKTWFGATSITFNVVGA